VDSTQNIISFCTGYGGIELGIKRAGVDVRTVCNVEIEAFVQANILAKIEEGRMDNAPIYSDLKTFPARIFRGKIHGVIGGYPCQPFSSAGKRKGEKDPRHLWPYIREHVRAVRPVWCFFENVRGHTTMGLWRVLSDLEEDGYRTEWGLFSAEETGAPHQRIRMFILAYRECERHRGRDTSGSRGVDTEGCDSSEEEQASHDIRCETSGCGGEPRETKLGDTKHDGSPTTQDGRSTCEEQEKGRMQELKGGCKQSQDELAHTASREPRQSQARNGGQDIGGGSEEELGNPFGRRFEQCESECEKEDFVSKRGQPTRWPARPGEEQYEWEEPRVTETQSELGGAVDGSACGVDSIANRVDRLRLLGNGVLPQTAELAWKSLWRKING
jgi:DNA (cytosine-5)-methyltransferase 1